VLILVGALMGANVITSVFQSIAQAIAGKNTTGVIVAVGISQLLGMVIQQLVLGVVLLGFTRMTIDVLQGKKADIARMFSEVSKLGTYMVQWLLVFVMFDLPTLLYFGGALVVGIRSSGHSLPSFDNPKRASEELVRMMLDVFPTVGLAAVIAIVPLWWMYLARLLIVPEMVYGGAGPFEAISRAFRLASGARLSLLGAYLVGAVVIVAGMLACCIGVLPAVALFTLLMTTIYLALRNGSDLPPPPQS
jgi:uncharacterized membrane protein